MNTTLLSKCHYNDFKLELVENKDEIKVVLAKGAFAKSIIQSVTILLVVIVFLWMGYSEGFIRELDRGILVLTILILLSTILIPAVLNFVRISEIGDHIIKFNKHENLISGAYFQSLDLKSVRKFIIVSKKLGEITPYEIQLVLEKNNPNFVDDNMLVYASSTRLDRGEIHDVFSNFSYSIGKYIS